MERITRNVRDIETAERRVLEHVIGRKLTENQQLVIGVVNLDLSHPDTPPPSSANEVPPWWNIYEGLSDDEIDRLDKAVRQRANLTRVFE